MNASLRLDSAPWSQERPTIVPILVNSREAQETTARGLNYSRPSPLLCPAVSTSEALLSRAFSLAACFSPQAIKEHLAKALAAHALSGRAACAGSLCGLSAASPGMHVTGVGTVDLPLTTSQVRAPGAQTSPFAFGRSQPPIVGSPCMPRALLRCRPVCRQSQASALRAKASPDSALSPLAWRIDAAAVSFVNPGWATAVASAKVREGPIGQRWHHKKQLSRQE